MVARCLLPACLVILRCAWGLIGRESSARCGHGVWIFQRKNPAALQQLSTLAFVLMHCRMKLFFSHFYSSHRISHSLLAIRKISAVASTISALPRWFLCALGKLEKIRLSTLILSYSWKFLHAQSEWAAVFFLESSWYFSEVELRKTIIVIWNYFLTMIYSNSVDGKYVSYSYISEMNRMISKLYSFFSEYKGRLDRLDRPMFSRNLTQCIFS